MRNLIAGILLAVFSTVSHAALPIESWTLDNGTRVFFMHNGTIPILDIRVDFDAGKRRDPAGKAGLAAMVNTMIARGIKAEGVQAPAYSEAQISDAFADIAAQYRNKIDDDRSGLTLRTLGSERQAAVAMLARLIASPAFPEEHLAREKARAIASLRENLTRPAILATRSFRNMLYGKHPYGVQATETSLTSLTQDDLYAFYTQHYVANRAVITLVGDISRTEAKAIAQRLTEKLPQGASLPELPALSSTTKGELRIAHASSQAHILIGMPILQRGDEDYFTLMVGNYILGGGGFVSRLMQEVREKRGLTYGVSSHFNTMAQPGPFQIGLQTKAKQAEEALQVVRDTVDTFLREGPTEAEVKAAKSHLAGGFALRISTNKELLENIAMIGFYGLPLDYLDTWVANVQQVTSAQIRTVFTQRVRPEQFSTVVVGAS